MAASKIVLLVIPYDQGDILSDFIDWHLDLGFDFVLAQDGGSNDGSRETLDRYAKTGRVAWFPLPERDMTKYDMVDTMGEMARDRFGADWLVFLDADEFVCTTGSSLRSVLERAEREGVSLLNLKRYNMTGAVPQPGESAIRSLSLRIDRPVPVLAEQFLSDDLPAPALFVGAGMGKVAVRADAFAGYGLGMHSAKTTAGISIETSDLYILHYAVRCYDDLLTKVANVRNWFRDNPHLSEGWAVHWRRLVRLQDQGLLRADYESQFVTPERAAELIRTGVCSVDETVLRWARARDATRLGAGWH